ncbi:MAG: hypothetical protein OEM99_16370 [Gammaproteobacteria bacterium]|nr:hypothetical protein [Gammaproteobacteria bacterium]
MKFPLRNAMLFAVAILYLLPTLAVATDPQTELQRNPFSQPAVEELTIDTTPVNQGLSAERDPGLRAVLVAGKNSVVDIGGVILQVGECTDGLCLLSVAEGMARVSRNDEEIVLSLYEQDNGQER